MAQRLLIVGAGANQAAIIRRARELGIETVAMDGDPAAAGLSVADDAVVGNILDGEAIAAAARAHRVDGIYPAAEPAVEAVAQAATALGLPGVAPEVAKPLRNKLVLRERLEAAGLPGPAYAGATTLDEARAAVARLGLPVIAKPADGNASKGVTRVDRADDVAAAFERARAKSRLGVVLFEQFMEGEEYNVDGLVYEGRYVPGGQTAKDRSAPPNRFDLGIHMPPLEPAAVQDMLYATVAQALGALGFRNGTSHAEVILTADGPRLVEIAGRPGGGRIPTDLIPLTYGMDFTADSLRIALGEPPRETRCRERGAALYWVPAAGGVVERVEGVDAAWATPGVRDVLVSVRPGDVVETLVDCVTRDRIGYVLADGETVREAIAAAVSARDAIRVVTVPAA